MNKNSLVLAYLGDAYFELFIRSYIVSLNDLKVKDLQKIVTSIVSAKGQANLLNKLIDEDYSEKNKKLIEDLIKANDEEEKALRIEYGEV